MKRRDTAARLRELADAIEADHPPMESAKSVYLFQLGWICHELAEEWFSSEALFANGSVQMPEEPAGKAAS